MSASSSAEVMRTDSDHPLAALRDLAELLHAALAEKGELQPELLLKLALIRRLHALLRHVQRRARHGGDGE
jgi:hypothetical protein